MSWYAYVNLAENVVLVVREHDVPPTPAPHKIELQADEFPDKGWTYAPGETPRFKPPVVPRVWTAYQFLLRFTEAELLGIRTAANTDPITWRFLTLATAAQEIVSDDPQTVAGMDYLVSAGLLTEQRKGEILG
jgi:hypothetical protein